MKSDDPDPQIVEIYRTPAGYCPYEVWFDGLKDRTTKYQIEARITRLRAGNPGRWKSVGGGVFEMALDFGPGYRIYAGQLGSRFLLLCAGFKKTQEKDIANAKEYLAEYVKTSAQIRKGKGN